MDPVFFVYVNKLGASCLSSSRILNWRVWDLPLLPLLCCLSAPCWWGGGLGFLLEELGEEDVYTLGKNRVQNFPLLWREPAQDMTLHRHLPHRPADPDPKSGHHLQEGHESVIIFYPHYTMMCLILYIIFGVMYLFQTILWQNFSDIHSSENDASSVCSTFIYTGHM